MKQTHAIRWLAGWAVCLCYRQHVRADQDIVGRHRQRIEQELVRDIVSGCGARACSSHVALARQT